ncbi:MAG: cytochrome P450 [Cyclobacteriaceae bacterium]|nr:cytochrome P450 [Cyclobacteriaceae bacterium]
MESPWKPFLRENMLDPYPMYKELRENDPIHQSRTGEWVITRYEDAKAILKDDRFIVGNRAEWLSKAATQHMDKWESFAVIIDALRSFLVFKNPPDHALLRKFIMQAWNSREVDQIINENIEKLFSTIDPSHFDVVSQLATPLPAMTMARIFGLPTSDYQYLEDLSHKMIQSLDLYLTFRQIKKMEDATKAFIAYFEKHAAIKLAKPDDGLLSRLIQLNKESKTIHHHELIANCFFLFISGEETTAGLIELGLYHLITNNKLNPGIQDTANTAIEEILRYDSPLQIVVRIASEDVELGKQKIVAGSAVTICLGAANRDPEKFQQPDELLLSRTPNHHLSFGSGVHRCLGDWLAKKEFELLLNYLGRYDSFKIAKEPVWKENMNMRSFQSFAISCE